MIVRTLVCALALATPSFSVALADDPTSIELYESALQSVRVEAQAEPPAFCGYVLDAGDELGRYRFDQLAPDAARWRDGDDELADLEETGLPVNGLPLAAVRPDMFDSTVPVQHLRDDGNIAVYGIRVAEFEMSGMGQTVNIAEHLQGEAGVDRETGRFTFVRFYAPEEFKPSPIARFRTFDFRVDVASAWEGGPLVRSRTVSDIVVSAMFQTHDLGSTRDFSEFVPCAG
jgi:hypothetical protein